MSYHLVAVVALLSAFASVVPRAALAQNPSDAPAAEVPAGAPAAAENPNNALPERQQQVAQLFRQLESVLLRMAELSDDPERVTLLRKAVAQSKNQLIGEQLNEIAALLERDRLANALTEQGEVRADLTKLLELLLSEDRGQNLDEEKRRLQQWIRDIGNLIKDQQGLQGETEGGAESQGLADQQGKLGEKTGRVADAIADAEDQKRADENPAAEPKTQPEEKPAAEDAPKEGDQPAETPPADGKPTEGQPADGKPSEGQPSEGQPSEGQPSEGQPSEGQPSEGQPSEGAPAEPQAGEEQPQNPTQQRLKSAQQRMQAAQKKLQEAQRKQATEEQEAAIRELREAKAELEKILQQLREEEMQRMLAMLEQRFRKMLAAQIDVYEATQRLDSVAIDQRTRNDEIEAGRQSRRESSIADDARRALELLKQDGTSVAFPEAVQQLIEDMDQTAAWLGAAKVGELTQALEKDIIAALEEMIGALEQAQKDLEEQEQQPSEPSEQEQEEPPLVDSLAELKLIRSLQIWVNKRTQLYGQKLTGELTPDEGQDLHEALEKLAVREQRIYRTTRDIVQEKNQ